jgi:hypothetical protein
MTKKLEIHNHEIEFEKNVATLFVKDETGNLARSYLALLREEETGRSAAGDTTHLQLFAAQFTPPRLSHSP